MTHVNSYRTFWGWCSRSYQGTVSVLVLLCFKCLTLPIWLCL